MIFKLNYYELSYYHTDVSDLYTIKKKSSISFHISYQRWHVSTVHLTHCDLLLGRRHGTHAERLGADRARSNHPWQCHRAVLQPAHTVKLLLEDGGPANMCKAIQMTVKR